MASARFFLDDSEKKTLVAQAEREGVSLSLLIYRRVFNAPDAEPRPVGRPPKQQRSQPEELFPMTG